LAIGDFRLPIFTYAETPMELFGPLWKMLFDIAVVAGIVWLIRRLAISAGHRAQKRAGNWAIAQGTVEHASPKHASPKMAGEGRTGYWIGELSYSYSVDGEYYAGVAQLPASSEDHASEVVRGWKDRKVQVRYMPRNRARSVLITNEQALLASN
jgi:hypothetical protein